MNTLQKVFGKHKGGSMGNYKPVYYKLTERVSEDEGVSINQNFAYEESRGRVHPLRKHYREGITVTAWKSTPGIYFFKTIKDAVAFAKTWRGSDFTYDRMHLFLVQPIGKVRQCKQVLCWNILQTLITWRLFAKYANCTAFFIAAPKGTYTAPAVRVVERSKASITQAMVL